MGELHLWESYTRSAFDVQGRIVEHSGGDRTTSEGQAYGMLFALAERCRKQMDLSDFPPP